MCVYIVLPCICIHFGHTPSCLAEITYILYFDISLCCTVPVPSILSTTGNCSIVELTVAWDSQENSGNSLQITNVSISYDVISVSFSL